MHLWGREKIQVGTNQTPNSLLEPWVKAGPGPGSGEV